MVQEVRTREARGGRRKAGCFACRSRHMRCDEEKPTCKECRKRHLTCGYPEFIVASQWCPSGPKSDSNQASTPKSTGGSPRSTWDIFRLSKNDLANVPHTICPVSQESALNVDQETAELLRVYQTGIATWMDLFDHAACYQRDIPKRAMSSPLIRQSICALSAKQLSLISAGSIWASVATSRYGCSLSRLLSAIADPYACQEDILAATILLSSYELLTAPGEDYRKHLLGATTLIKCYKYGSSLQPLNRAAFWIYARQDIALALTNECPTSLAPSEWQMTWPLQDVDDEMRGNHILWLLSRTINLIYTKGGSPSGMSSNASSDSIEEISQAVDDWLRSCPSEFAGLTCGQASWEGFAEMWFHVPAAAAAMATYHEVKLLLLTESQPQPIIRSRERHEKIQYHAICIGSIALSKIADGALVQMVQPLYYAAKYIDGTARKAKLWAVLNDIESRLGFHTRSRVEQLQRMAP